jgi:RHS repeat-associated protein
MNGELTPPENSETDFPSPPPADPLSPSSNMSPVQCPTEIPTHPVAEEWYLPPQGPPEDDPPTGNILNPPTPPPKPPAGGILHNSLEISDSDWHKPTAKTVGVTYYGYRYYDPVTGRWPSRDRIEERGGINLYGFVGNLPTTRFDVLGNIWFFGWAIERATYELDKSCLGCCLVGGLWSLASEKCRESYNAVMRFGTSFDRDFVADSEADTAFVAEMEAVEKAWNQAKDFKAPNCFKFSGSITVFQDAIQTTGPPII